ncbi:hypothetical protein B0T16DRAFT_460455 [Cercophora newfieldiana]|uniref:Formylmethionine deformylase-like protein n=1 Tax=Cercophora newfieldiana TaxID=92897 RepID=A0AA40CP17_9PEZI|nr:hypothetical protein B0T16DRAFT_460455 [Cercophora newfieldiana]
MSAYQLGDLPPSAGWSPGRHQQNPFDGSFPDTEYQSTYESLRSTSSQQQFPRERVDDEAELLPKAGSAPSITSPSAKISGFFRSLTTSTSLSTPPYGAPFFANEPRRSKWWRWNPSWNLYLFFAFGVACAIGHHAYYASLDGKPAADQLQMLRYGMALAFASKAGLSAAVVLAYRQRVWTTVRTKMMGVVALDSLFAATEDLWALLNWEMIRTAKIAVALAVFVWVAPLVVILTGNTLLVEPSTAVIESVCPGVRTLNFAKEEEYEWRDPPRIAQLFEIPLSLWNTTKPSDSEPPGWFDYYTAPYPTLEQTSTIGAFLEQAVMRKNAQIETCGSGWNCTFEIKFTAPAYRCTELASGVGSKAKNLTQESGSIAPPFDTDIILPKGRHSYYAFNTGGDYSTVQMKDVGIGGIPNMEPPYPKNFGAFRTEPVVWIGYAEIADPTKPIPTDPSSPEWETAFIPKLFACENYESSYTVRVKYAEGAQSINTTNLTHHNPVINTTFLPHVDANDGTSDNITAVPESNYILPTDKARYRRTAAYHSLGLMLRTFLNGTILIDKDLVNPIVNTPAIQTRLLDPQNNYFPRANLQSLVQPFYEEIILSMLSQPQFAPVVWAAKPDEQSGQLVKDEEGYRYPCSKSRTRNMYKYHARDLWIVYSIAILLALVGVVTGSWAMGGNQGGLRDTKWSDIVAATRGPALDKVNWEGRTGEVPVPVQDVGALRVGYGVVGGGVADGGLATGWEGTRYGFGLEGEVRQVKREGSIWKLASSKGSLSQQRL